jgi:hypothetical protein
MEKIKIFVPTSAVSKSVGYAFAIVFMIAYSICTSFNKWKGM